MHQFFLIDREAIPGKVRTIQTPTKKYQKYEYFSVGGHLCPPPPVKEGYLVINLTTIYANKATISYNFMYMMINKYILFFLKLPFVIFICIWISFFSFNIFIFKLITWTKPQKMWQKIENFISFKLIIFQNPN